MASLSSVYVFMYVYMYVCMWSSTAIAAMTGALDEIVGFDDDLIWSERRVRLASLSSVYVCMYVCMYVVFDCYSCHDWCTR